MLKLEKLFHSNPETAAALRGERAGSNPGCSNLRRRFYRQVALACQGWIARSAVTWVSLPIFARRMQGRRHSVRLVELDKELQSRIRPGATRRVDSSSSFRATGDHVPDLVIGPPDGQPPDCAYSRPNRKLFAPVPSVRLRKSGEGGQTVQPR